MSDDYVMTPARVRQIDRNHWIVTNLPHRVVPKGMAIDWYDERYLGHCWQAWCSEHVGERAITTTTIARNYDLEPNPNARWEATSQGFYFKDDNDALAFKMRWG